MQSSLKNRKTKKQLRKKLSQRGGSGRPSSHGPSRRSTMGTTQEQEYAALLAKHEPPEITITVKVEDINVLEQSFPQLNKIIVPITKLYNDLKIKQSPQDTKKHLEDANNLLSQVITRLNTFIYSKTLLAYNEDKQINAMRWCAYIEKLIALNYVDIQQINKVL